MDHIAYHPRDNSVNSQVCEQLLCLETKLAICQSRTKDVQPRHQRALLFALQQRLACLPGLRDALGKIFHYTPPKVLLYFAWLLAGSKFCPFYFPGPRPAAAGDL